MHKETITFTFRIPVDLKAALEKIAAEQDRSLSKQIISALRQFVKDTDGESKPPAA